tara:strand:- start:378 stop:1595 length:1218 start_codon:yes stop_codon:yes gene_type:complete
MKKLLIILLCLPFIGFGQNFVVTPNGLRDNNNLEKTHVVIYTPGKTAKQNYNSTLLYIKDILKKDISKKTQNEFISFNTNIQHLLDVNNVMTYIAFSANYTTKLTFINDSILFEITDLDIYMKDDSKLKVVFLGSYLSMTSHAIYIGKKKSKIQKRMKQTKTDIENYFNNQIYLFNNHLKSAVKNDNEKDIVEKSKGFFNIEDTPKRFLNAHSVELLRKFDRNNFEVLDYYGKVLWEYSSCYYLVRDINNKTGFVYKNRCKQILNAKIDKENQKEVFKNKKPLNIIGVAIEDINSADGVDISITWQYLDTLKDLKYLYFTIAPYNCVGDPVKGRYDDGQQIGKITGPIYGSLERNESHWKAFWYNKTICSIKIVKVQVEYMDGSKYTYVKELNKISSPYLKYYSF